MDTAILLPGLDGTGELFGPFVNAARSDIQTVVVEYPVDEDSMDALEQHARSKLVNRCIVIAESFSGPIGVRLAADPRVRALVLCNSFVTSPFAPSLRHFAVAPLFAIPFPKFALRSALLGRYASPDLLEIARRAIARVPAHVIAKKSSGSVANR